MNSCSQYTLPVSPAENFTVTALPARFWWLERCAFLLGLKSSRSVYPAKITIARLLPEDPVRTESWEVFGSPDAKVALHQENRHLVMGIPDEAETDEEVFAAGIKMLMVGISTLLSDQSLLFHAAVLVRDGQAVLVAASSGGGKTTTARRVPSPWFSPGDENCLVVIDGQGEYHVHVFPTVSIIATGMGGHSWNITPSYPLKGICVLKQADEDRIECCPYAEAILLLTDSIRQASQTQMSWMREPFRREVRNQWFGQACLLARKVPVYLLSATLTGRFWELLESEILAER